MGREERRGRECCGEGKGTGREEEGKMRRGEEKGKERGG